MLFGKESNKLNHFQGVSAFTLLSAYNARLKKETWIAADTANGQRGLDLPKVASQMLINEPLYKNALVSRCSEALLFCCSFTLPKRSRKQDDAAAPFDT